MVRIAHRRNVMFTDHEVYDTLTNLLSCISARKFGYSHSELLFSDGVAFSSLFTIQQGQCILPDFSRPKGGLAMFRRKEGYGSNLWRFTRLPIDAAKEAELRSSCENLTRECISEGEQYDRKGVLRFILGFWPKEDPKGYFCSEAVYDRVQTIELFLKCMPEFKVSPNLLARLCEERFGPVSTV